MKGIRESGKGIILDIEVSPNSKEEAIRGYDEWRGRITVAMKEKPEKFRVNKEIVDFFSRIFNVDKSRVRIVAGEKSRQKSVLIEGVSLESARKILRIYLGEN